MLAISSDSRAWSRNAGPLTANLLLRSGEYAIEAMAGELRANGKTTVAAPGPARTVLQLWR
jgi:hypothetical protein